MLVLQGRAGTANFTLFAFSTILFFGKSNFVCGARALRALTFWIYDWGGGCKIFIVSNLSEICNDLFWIKMVFGSIYN